MIAKDQFGEWKHHPASKFFFQFMRDRRAQLIGMANETWLNSGKTDEVERGRILSLFELDELSFEVIETFYKERENEAQDIVSSEGGIPAGDLQRQE